MKRVIFVWIGILIAALVQVNAQQVATYQSLDGTQAQVAVVSNGIMMQLDRQQPFFLPASGMQNGWFYYATQAGGAMFSADMQKMVLVTFNPAATVEFNLIGFSGGGAAYSVPDGNSYRPMSSGRSRAQIEYDIRKTQQLLEDNKRNLKNLQDSNQSYTLWPAYQRMIRENESRLLQLQQELRNADH
ncbi:MAG: hypothetical protein LIP00_09700 [Parabacteroides sp.]|nr:hypothetical protein [Parabacteroides sp.]